MSSGSPKPEKLVEYARDRHGYGIDDYYGVTYASDIDNYMREQEGIDITEGFVDIDYWDGSPEALRVSETRYLEALKEHLIKEGFEALASQLDGL